VEEGCEVGSVGRNQQVKIQPAERLAPGQGGRNGGGWRACRRHDDGRKEALTARRIMTRRGIRTNLRAAQIVTRKVWRGEEVSLLAVVRAGRFTLPARRTSAPRRRKGATTPGGMGAYGRPRGSPACGDDRPRVLSPIVHAAPASRTPSGAYVRGLMGPTRGPRCWSSTAFGAPRRSRLLMRLKTDLAAT